MILNLTLKLAVLKYLVLSSFYLLISTSLYVHSLQGVFGARPSYPPIQVGDPADDWTFRHNKAHLGLYCDYDAPGKICVDRQPISITECKIADSSTDKLSFPSPDISSISYISDGKILNVTGWLKHPFRDNLGNNTNVPYSFVSNENVSQSHSSFYVLSADNRNLEKVVKEHVERTNKSLTDFYLYRNESELITIQGNPAQKLVYTYTGEKVRDGCEKCKETNFDIKR